MKYVVQKEQDKEYRKRLGVYAIIQRKEDNKIGIVTDGDFFFLGGGIEDGETKLEALKRELIEESGYTLKNKENKNGRKNRYKKTIKNIFTNSF